MKQKLENTMQLLAKEEVRCETLRKKLEEATLDIQKAGEAKNKLESLDMQTKREGEILKQRVQDLQQQLDKLEKKLEEAKVEIQKGATMQNDLSIEKEKLKVQLSHNAELQSQLNAEKSALQKNLNEMSGDVTMKRVERERMMQELAQMKTLQQRVRDQQEELARLK